MSHQCEAMAFAIKEGYLHQPLQFDVRDNTIKVLPAAIAGAPLKPRSRKRKPSLLLTFCPFCGEKLEDAENDYSAVRNIPEQQEAARLHDLMMRGDNEY